MTSTAPPGWHALVLAAAGLIGWSATRTVLAIRFDQDIGGHLKLAADANSIGLASSEVEAAATAAERWGICPTDGHTSILWRTPDEDVGFWCTNIAATGEDLSSAPSDLDNLTESNMLIKVRETLLDHGQKGDRVTVPQGVSVYPHNSAFAWWGILSALLALAGMAQARILIAAARRAIILLPLVSVAVSTVLWGFWGSSHTFAPGGILVLRFAWPLLLGIAVPMVVFGVQLWRR